MVEIIRKIKIQLGDSNFIILWFEQLIFSVLYGAAFRSWVVFGVIFLGSFWLLNRPRGTMYMIYAMSLLWGFIAFSIGYSISWGWAALLGGSFFLVGIKAHFRGLRMPMITEIFPVNDNYIGWRRNGCRWQQNFN